MGIKFNADEVFELAEQMERNGARFYRRAARAADDQRVRDVLERLAAMEDDHEQTFVAMRAELTGKERAPTVYDPEGEAAGYLRAMVGGHVFDVKTDPSTQLTGKESIGEIYRTAIGLEKDSVVYYLGIAKFVPESLGEEKVNDIIKEEMGHITLLSNELVSLQK